MKKISYAELVKNENLILCNNITNLELELYCGNDYDEENDYPYDIYQYYLIDQSFADYLARATDEIVYYCDELDLYVWGVTHFALLGTASILTSKPLMKCALTVYMFNCGHAYIPK